LLAAAFTASFRYTVQRNLALGSTLRDMSGNATYQELAAGFRIGDA
jgi:hypothetical protein